MPRMLTDVVRAIIGADADIEVLSDNLDAPDIDGAVERARADVAIIGCAGEAHDARWITVLWKHPHLKLFVLEHDGRRTLLYELNPQRTDLGELSPASLREALSAAAPGRVT
jgi:hypothetical protein